LSKSKIVSTRRTKRFAEARERRTERISTYVTGGTSVADKKARRSSKEKGVLKSVNKIFNRNMNCVLLLKKSEKSDPIKGHIVIYY
jgi:hypothetical protein